MTDSTSTQRQLLALTGILSDPDKRRKYDVGGFDSLDTRDREIHVDLSSLGVVSTAVAALFTKLGESAVLSVHCHEPLMLLHARLSSIAADMAWSALYDKRLTSVVTKCKKVMQTAPVNVLQSCLQPLPYQGTPASAETVYGGGWCCRSSSQDCGG